MALILFEDIFDVKDIDPDGKKFERGLILCTCTQCRLQLVDFVVIQNTMLAPMLTIVDCVVHNVHLIID